jgi:hypothetical protein
VQCVNRANSLCFTERHKHLHFALGRKKDQGEESVVKVIFRSAVEYYKMGCGSGNRVKISQERMQ